MSADIPADAPPWSLRGQAHPATRYGRRLLVDRYGNELVVVRANSDTWHLPALPETTRGYYDPARPTARCLDDMKPLSADGWRYRLRNTVDNGSDAPTRCTHDACQQEVYRETEWSP